MDKNNIDNESETIELEGDCNEKLMKKQKQNYLKKEN